MRRGGVVVRQVIRIEGCFYLDLFSGASAEKYFCPDLFLNVHVVGVLYQTYSIVARPEQIFVQTYLMGVPGCLTDLLLYVLSVKNHESRVKSRGSRAES